MHWTRFQSRLASEWTPSSVLRHPLIEHPELLFIALGWEPDQWQVDVMTEREDQLVCVSRQRGKSAAIAATAVSQALGVPGSLTAIISRSQEQAAEVLLKCKQFHLGWKSYVEDSESWRAPQFRFGAEDEDSNRLDFDAAVSDTVKNSILSMEFANGSRIKTTACSASTVVGYTTDLLLLDEAARIPDQVYLPALPLLTIAKSKGKGRLIAASTPYGKRGWFWEGWSASDLAKSVGKKPQWKQTRITAVDPPCARISQELLDDMREKMGDHAYQENYECVFRDAQDAVFREVDIARATSGEVMGRLFNEV